jgi:hypothetical protein
MSLAETRTALEYNDAACRKHLAKAIAAHQAKVSELTELRAAIMQAEVRLTSMQEAIDKSADIVDAVTELAAKALRTGHEFSERSPALKAQQKRDALIEELALLKTGFVHLRARAAGLERQVAAEYEELVRVREPIIRRMLEELAEELFVKESEAASLRARLFGFSTCSNGPVPQKLPLLARNLLGNPPANAAHPQTNSPGHFRVQKEKQAFRDWKKALETDANAQLSLD